MRATTLHRRLAAAVALAALATGCSGADDPDAGSSDGATETAAAIDPLDEDVIANLDDDTLVVLGAYPIDPETDELIGDVDPEHAATFERFTEVIPADLRPEVTMFVAIDMDASGGTDGAMQPFLDAPDDRYIALDTTGASAGSELDRTMVHEFAHLLTLRPSQLDDSAEAVDDCPVYAEAAGCPLDDAYLTAYYLEFWDGMTEDEIDEGGEDAAALRFEEECCVTDYAATLPGEDAAETFAEWVLADELPTGDSIVDQKLRFFEDYPEVVDIRERIREGLFS